MSAWAAWGMTTAALGKAPPTRYDITGTDYRRERLYNPYTNWPTTYFATNVTSGSVISAGKQFAFPAMSAWRGHLASAAMPYVPAGITSAVLWIDIFNRVQNESFGFLNVRLGANGANWATAGPYDIAAQPLLGYYTYPIPGAYPIPITLDLAVLALHVGEELSFLLSTSVEEAGGGSVSWSSYCTIQCSTSYILIGY